MAETMLALEIGEKYFEDFMKKIPPSYRAANLLFAYYAAFPLVFSPDMLYQLWLNFQDYKKDGKLQLLPMVVVSDLLQSGFCQEVAFELYELNGELAAYLNRNIKKISEDRELVLLYSHKDIAVFTLSYAEQYLQHPNRRNLYNIYYWKSLLEAYPEKASKSIQDALNANSTDTDAAIFLAIADRQKPLTNTPNPQEDYNKLPFFSYDPDKDKNHKEITDKSLARQIAKRLGLRESIVTRSESYKNALRCIQQAKATNATQLDLSGLGLTEIPEEIGELVTLKELYLSTGMAGELVSFITDISPLANLTNLTILELRECQISDITPLSNLVQLTDLQIGRNLISDISPLLPHYKRGIKIDVTNNPITTPPIEIVNQGREAILHYFEGQEQAQRLIAQARAQNLKRLDLGNCGLTDLETQAPELFELEQLEELVLSNMWWDWNKRTWVQSSNKGTPNKLKQLPKSWEKLRKLKTLIWGGEMGKVWQISDISSVAQLSNLQSLQLRYCMVADISVIAQLQQLCYLDLSGNKISNISPLTQLKQLTHLRLNGNKIADARVLTQLEQLTYVEIERNKIESIEPLLPLLERLDIVYKASPKNDNTISVYNNFISIAEKRAIEKGKRAIVDYFKSSNVKTKIDTSINIFVVYADEDRTYFRELQTNLSPLERNHTIKIRSADNFLSDRSMQQLYDEALHNADLILCLISADFFVSDEHYEILEKALQHHQKGEAMLIPIILRACDWKRFPFDQLQVLPKNETPIRQWVDRDEAYRDIAYGILDVVEEIHARKINKEKQDLEIQQLPQPIQQLINDMITVEGGSFMMGSNEYDDEKPIHQVSLSTFKIGKYPVTQAQWQAVMNNNPSGFKGEQNPVEQVSWEDAVEFCHRLSQLTGKNYRLPTEAEWEYAARGGNKSRSYKYAGSNNLDTVAWYEQKGGATTRPVGQKKPNELGLYDLSGNVWEWCNDWYAADYYKNSPANNPTGPTSGSGRVSLRGGSWGSGAAGCRVAYRNDSTPSYRADYGFRLAVR